MKYELKHWAGLRYFLRSSGSYKIGTTVERIYVNIPDSRESVGYIERRCVVAGRKGNSNSYYDQHRISKGDTGEITSDVITIVCGELSEAISIKLANGCADCHRDMTIWNKAREIALGTQRSKPVKYVEL